MNKKDDFLKSQKVLRLATIGKNKMPHIAPVWYRYVGKKILHRDKYQNTKGKKCNKK